MAHRTSAAALHTARTLQKNFTLTPKPQTELPSGQRAIPNDSEAHLSIVIDYATNAFQLAILRPELRYWQERIYNGSATAPQLASFFKRMLDAFALIPKFAENEVKRTTTLEAPIEFRDSRPVVQTLSKPAMETARFVLHYYTAVPKRGVADSELDRMRIAKLAESSLELTRACAAEPLLEKWYKELKQGRATVQDIRTCFREVGVCLALLPGYAEPEEELKLLL